MKIALQVFKKVAFVEKPHYTPGLRKSFWEWPQSIESDSGLMDGNTLLFPKHKSTPSGNQVILIDSLQHGLQYDRTISPCTKQVFEIFRIVHGPENSVELHTHFTDSRFSEIPQADNHQIGLLGPGDTIRYIANDRMDFSSVARKQRTYILYDYIIIHLGHVGEIKPIDTIKLKSHKSIDLKDCKMVDERKVLK